MKNRRECLGSFPRPQRIPRIHQKCAPLRLARNATYLVKAKSAGATLDLRFPAEVQVAAAEACNSAVSQWLLSCAISTQAWARRLAMVVAAEQGRTGRVLSRVRCHLF